MIYLTRMLGKPVVDAAGDEIGIISDIAIATGEVFPRVTALAFKGPDKTPLMLSWRKYVAEFDNERIVLNAARPDLRFSYLQPDEVLLHRDLLNKQIVDTQGMKVVRVNDLKLSESRNQLRLLGAEVGARGLLRGISPALERAVERVAGLFGRTVPEDIIAWNYMDLLERDLSSVKLSVTHKRLHELHPADMADILEKLTPAQRAKVFEHLDDDQVAETISEMEDDIQADVVEDFSDQRASDILEIMDPDDAADIIGDLPYDKAEALLRLMGVKEARQVRKLLGYKEKTAGGIMTPEVTTVTEEATVQEVIEHLRGAAAENENIYYIYVVGPKRVLEGVISLRDLIVSAPDTRIADIVERELFTAGVDDDQEQVADMMSKYDLLALPVVDEAGRLLGMVTVDDALDVLDEEAAEDLALATGSAPAEVSALRGWLGRGPQWIIAWAVYGVAVAGLLRLFWDRPALFLVAAAFLPLAVRLSEEVASHALGRLIERGSDEAVGVFLRRFMVDVAAGAALGVISGLVALAVLQAMRQPIAVSSALSLSVGLTVLALAIVGAILPSVLTIGDTGRWRASSPLVTALMGAGGAMVFMSLTALLQNAFGK
ncbi:MAG: magnesium transporter [Coriobacteriia bacterium]|nr:magnesium transporter [Coriobacteriia bacterium]